MLELHDLEVLFSEEESAALLLCLVDDDHGAVDRAFRVVAALQFFVVLSIELITPPLLHTGAVICY